MSDRITQGASEISLAKVTTRSENFLPAQSREQQSRQGRDLHFENSPGSASKE